MPMASSWAAIATFSESDCFSLLSPSICSVASWYWAFTRVFSSCRFWFSRFRESISMTYDRNTARTVASSFFSRVISRASLAFTCCSSASSRCVFSCSADSCATMESLLICAFISLYCKANCWYSFSISCLSSAANSCISRFSCFCLSRFRYNQTTPPMRARQSTTRGIKYFFISLWRLLFSTCKSIYFLSNGKGNYRKHTPCKTNFCNFREFLNNTSCCDDMPSRCFPDN